MGFKQRRELLFVYSVKDANPNGDPLNENHPRFDDASGHILVSDVRVKRTIRDQWLREGKDVFVDGEVKTLKMRVDELKRKLQVKTGKEVVARCIDTRLFGVTFALDKEAFSWTGPLQFKWGRSLHRTKPELIQGTAAFAKEEKSEQRSIRNEYIVPFVLVTDYAIANQHASAVTGATDEDLDAMFDALWQGTANLLTRSKVGHLPRFLLEVKYKEGFDGAIGALDEKVSLLDKNGVALSEDTQLALRSCDEIVLNTKKLAENLKRMKENIVSVKIVKDSALNVDKEGWEEIETLFGGMFTLKER